MPAEIIQPQGLFICIEDSTRKKQKVSVQALGVSYVTFNIPGAVQLENYQAYAIEIHGKEVSLNLPVCLNTNGSYQLSWHAFSFNFTLYNLWVAGLNIDQREHIIAEVLEWQEDVEKAVYFDDFEAGEDVNVEPLKKSA